MFRIADEQARLGELLRDGESVDVEGVARTVIPLRKGLLAVTAGRLIFSSKKHSASHDLARLSTVALTREGRHGTIRATVDGEIQVYLLRWADAQQLTDALTGRLAATP